LPVRIVLSPVGTDGKPGAGCETWLREAKEVGDGRWFPMHVVLFDAPRTPGQTVAVRDIRVTELMFDRVNDSDLELEVAAGTTVFRRDMPVGGKEFFTFRQTERLSPSEIPRIEAMLKEAGEGRLKDTAVGNSARRSGWKWYVLAGGLVSLCLVALLYIRKRRRTT